MVSIPLTSLRVQSPAAAPAMNDGGSNPPDDDDDDDDDSNDSVFIANPAPAPRRRARRALGPRPGSYIPPAPANAAEQPRVWNRGQGRKYTFRLLFHSSIGNSIHSIFKFSNKT